MAGLFRTIATAFSARSSLERLRAFRPMLVSLAGFTVIFTALFHLFMSLEGRGDEHSLITGIYWSLTTMSTLGYGDITFRADGGRILSMVAMLVGVVWFQIVLTWFVIQYLFMPWARAQAEMTVPRAARPDLSGHVILTSWDAVTEHLVGVLERQGIPHLLLLADPALALRLHDRGLSVILGEPDDPAAWRGAAVERAALVATTLPETANANVVVTVREVAPTVPLVAQSRSDAGDEVLRLAGADQVMRLGLMLGEALARRVTGPDAAAHHLAAFSGLDLAESPANGTPLVGRTLRQLALRTTTGVSVLCVWERGKVLAPDPDRPLDRRSVLVLAGTRAGLAAFNAAYAPKLAAPCALVIGAGRVGRSCALALLGRGIEVRSLDLVPGREVAGAIAVTGDGRDHATLDRAGLQRATSVLLTTHDDDLNIFLAILCRRLRPEVQIIARVSAKKNVETILRAGADVVLSYAALGAAFVLGRLSGDRDLVISQGLHLSRVPVPAGDAGRRIDEAPGLRRKGWQVLAILDAGENRVCPLPGTVLPSQGELLVAVADGGDRGCPAPPAAGNDLYP